MKNSQKFVQVISNEAGINSPDKNGKEYNTIKVKPLASTITDPATGEVFPVIDMNARIGTFNQWEDSYLIEGSDLAYNAKEGTLLPGAVVTRACAPYSFENAEGDVIDAESYTALVFGDTSDEASFELAVKSVFRSADHQLEGDTTEITISEDKPSTPVEA